MTWSGAITNEFLSHALETPCQEERDVNIRKFLALARRPSGACRTQL